jgi:hypothetical protein
MKKSTNIPIIVALLIVVAILFFVVPTSFAANIVGTNYKNVTVRTSVNITNSNPEVLALVAYDTSNVSLNNITVNAGALKSISCNASVRDWNGYNDITLVSATLYHITNNSIGPNSNNTHYTNSSCTLNASTGTYTGWYTCTFDLLYYANNGTWTCNVTARDTYSKNGSLTNTTYLYPVYALNITDGIDYGPVAVETFSSDIGANITNFGNMNINITVEGYGVTRGDGLAMNCTINGNITVGNEKFATSAGVAYASKNNLTSSAALIPGLMMPKQSNDTQVINATYWQLYIPPNPAGNCTGFVIFSAEAP